MLLFHPENFMKGDHVWMELSGHPGNHLCLLLFCDLRTSAWWEGHSASLTLGVGVGGEGRYSQRGHAAARPIGGSCAPPRTPRRQSHSLWKKEEKARNSQRQYHIQACDVSWRSGPITGTRPPGQIDLPCQPETQESEGKTNYPQQLRSGWEGGISGIGVSSCVKEE